MLLEQSPYLEGICYPPISKIYFQQFNDEVIKKVIQFCKYGKILSESSSDDDKEELMKFAEQTKMDKLKVCFKLKNKQQKINRIYLGIS